MISAKSMKSVKEEKSMIQTKTIFKRLEKEYKEAVNNPTIKKPMSFALYTVWRWCDVYEKERNDKNESSKV